MPQTRSIGLFYNSQLRVFQQILVRDFLFSKNLQSAYLNCIWRNCRLIDILSPHSIERKLKVNRINLHRIYANLHFCLFVQRGQCNHYFKTLFQKDFFCKAYYQELQKKKSNFFLKNYFTQFGSDTFLTMQIHIISKKALIFIGKQALQRTYFEKAGF